MTSALSKRIEKLEQAQASRTQGPRTIRRVVVETGVDLPAESPDELLICRVIVTPPERPADEPISETTQAVSPRIEHGDRTPIEIQRDERFHRPIRYPHCGTI
jgi:hypothetical protein